jgi:peroxiredoxin
VGGPRHANADDRRALPVPLVLLVGDLAIGLRRTGDPGQKASSIRTSPVSYGHAMRDRGYSQLPDGLPAPEDDGAADHLPGAALPQIRLPSTTGRDADLSAVGSPRAIVYVYPMTGTPGVPWPEGWDLIPGARGCTPESCGFRDHHAELAQLGAEVYGLSTQSTADQAEAAARLDLPFALLSDEHHRLAAEIGLPTFTVAGKRLYKRLTLVLRDRRIEHVFYPVFPPDVHAERVADWLRSNPVSS